jgi:hypothetical protein
MQIGSQVDLHALQYLAECTVQIKDVESRVRERGSEAGDGGCEELVVEIAGGRFRGIATREVVGLSLCREAPEWLDVGHCEPPES